MVSLLMGLEGAASALLAACPAHSAQACLHPNPRLAGSLGVPSAGGGLCSWERQRPARPPPARLPVGPKAQESRDQGEGTRPPRVALLRLRYKLWGHMLRAHFTPLLYLTYKDSTEVLPQQDRDLKRLH